MKIAYLITTYPCLSETFIQREIIQLEKLGFEIKVFATGCRIKDFVVRQKTNVCYRPLFFSLSAIWSVIFIVLRHPFRLTRLAVLIFRMCFISPKEAAIAFLNFHTICFFARIIQKQHIQHIHACFLSWPACIATCISTLLKLKFSISAHARDIYVESGAIDLKAENAEFITCCTKQGVKYLKKNLSSKYHNKVLLNYHGLEFDQFCDYSKKQKQKSDFIIAVGRMVEKKGFADLIKAFSRLSHDWPDISLLIVGEGPCKKELKSLIEKVGLSEKIYLAGWLNNKNTLKLIGQARFLVAASIIDKDGDRDGIPNIILEAFSLGTPVIASSLAGIKEAVVNEKTGLLIEPGNIIQLSTSIDRLLRDEALAVDIAHNARKMLEDNFNIENNCLKLANIFKKCSWPNNEKVKIVHIVEGFVGGMSTYLCNVLVSLKKADFDVTLIYSKKRSDEGLSLKIRQLKEHGINIHTVPMVRSVNPFIDIYCLSAMTKLFTKERFDIVHSHCSKAGVIARIAAKLTGVPNIYHGSHCFAFLRCGNFLTRKIYLIIEKLLARLTTKFIAVSGSDADSAINHNIFGENKCVIVENGLSTGKKCLPERSETIYQIRRSFNLPTESFIVTTACRLVEYKGLFSFIESARLSKSNAVFVIAGDGPLKKKLEKHIYKNNLSDKVRLLGHICDMDRLYSICDLVVLCSSMEAQPFVLLEAMRANCAILASDVPGNKELLINNRGVLVEPKPAKVAAAIDSLLDDSKKRFQLSQNAFNYFCSDHKLEDQVQKLINVYMNQKNTQERTL